MARKIQNEDIKSSTELIAAGGSAAQLPNDDKVYVTANSLNKTLKQAIIDGDIGGGVASPSIFGLLNVDDDGPTPLSGWTTSGGILSIESSSPLNGDESFKFAPSALNDETKSPSIIIPKRTLDNAGRSPILVEFAYDATNDGFRAIVKDNSSNELGFVDLDSTKNRAQILVNLKGTETSLSLTIKDQTHTASMNIVFDDIEFDDEPFRKIDVSPNTAPTTYVPSLSGFGTISNDNFKYHREGRFLVANFFFFTGTTSGTVKSISLPTGLTIDKDYLSRDITTASSSQMVGELLQNDGASRRFAIITATQTDATKVYLGSNIAGTDILTANNSLGDSAETSGWFKVPIVGWSEYNESVLVENADGSESTAFTPSTQGFGTISSNESYWHREGEFFVGRVKFTSGTVSASEARVYIPFTIASSSIVPSISVFGDGIINTNGSISDGVGYSYAVTAEAGNNFITFGSRLTGVSPLSKLTGSAGFASTSTYVFNFKVPIQGWSSVQAHIMDIADPYENDYNLTVLVDSSPTSSSTPSGAISSLAYQATGRVRVTLSSSLALTETPRIIAGLADTPVDVGQVKIEWITPPYVFDIHTGNTAGSLANGYTVDLKVVRKGADYREPKGYFIGQSVPMRTAYLNMTTYGYNFHGSGSTTSYKAHSFASVSGDSFVSVSGSSITLPAGKYEISYGVAGNGNTQWVHSDIYNSTDASVIQEFLNVSYNELSTTVSFNTVFATIELTATKTINIRTKSSNVGSGETISRPKITKVK